MDPQGGSWLDKLKAIIAGTSSSGTPPMGRTAPNEAQGRDSEAPGQDKPWDDPSLRAPAVQPMPMASPMASPAPVSPMEDAIRKAIALQKQREAVKMLAPDWINR